MMFTKRVAALALLGMTVAAPAFAQCDTRFSLRNESRVTVQEFYFNPSANSNWGPDRLGNAVLEPRQSMNFNPGGRGGNYDFRIVWSNGEAAELRRVNICEASTIVATNRGAEAR